MRLASLQSWLNGVALPGQPADFARQVARRLPDPFDTATLARLQRMAAGDRPSRYGRLKNLVERTAPGEPEGRNLPPPEPTVAERVDQLAGDVRRLSGQPEPTEIGPYGVPVLRAARILRGLPEAWREPSRQRPTPEARSYPAVERAIQQIDRNALVPAEARGQEVGNYADARNVARHLASQLDVAQQQQQDTVELRLGANYASVRDRDAILRELSRIVRLIRDSLPHRASYVRTVNVFFGDTLVRWIPVSGGSR
jgi:hypothetical protein